MKKTLLILALIFFSCSKEEAIIPCDIKAGLWEGQTIPYHLDERFEGTEQHELLLEAMGEFEALGFEFVRGYNLLDMPEDYVFIKWSGIANSRIGKTGGEQILYLPVKRMNTFYSTTVHEIGHLIGMHHTHKRADRDEYLTIHYENILEGNDEFFEASPNYFTGLDYYDVYSIMSYECHYKSKNSLPTMTLKDGSCFEPMETLSPGDIETINNMYCQ